MLALIIAVAMTVAMVAADQEKCDNCYIGLKECTDPCREAEVYIVPPTCNGRDCLGIFDDCWALNCIKNDEAVNEGSGDIE